MQSINKIHVNSSTEMSLNDRFTIMQHTSDNGRSSTIRKVRNRSVSQSRSRALPRTTTLRNKNLSQLLDLNQKIQAALRLKRVITDFDYLNKTKMKSFKAKETLLLDFNL